jgi:hypothetical protein
MDSHINFLRKAWKILMADTGGKFDRLALCYFVPYEVIERLPRQITIDEAVSACNDNKLVNDSLNMMINTLTRDWSRLKSDAKLELIRCIKE